MGVLPGMVEWVPGDAARFTKKQMSLDGTFASVLNVDTARGLGVFTSPTGESPAGSAGLRDIWVLNDAPLNVRRARTTFWGSPWVGGGSPDGSILPQHGLAVRVTEAGGRRRAIVVWQNIIFGVYWSILVGSWHADTPNGGNFANRQLGLQMPDLGKTVTVLSSSRSGGVVTLKLAEDAPFVAGSYLIVDVATSSFDGQFLIREVEGDIVRYAQAGADESGGAGTARNTFPYDVDVWIPNNDNIVLVRAKRRDNPTWPDWPVFDTDAGAIFPGGAGNNISTPDDAAFDLTGTVTLIADITPSNWTPGFGMSLISKFGTSNPSNQRSYRFRLMPTGKIDFGYSTTGTSGVTITPNNALPPQANNTRRAVAAEFIPDDGAGNKRLRVYTAPTHKGPWTLHEDFASAGTAGAPLFVGTAPLEIGGVNNGSTELFVGRMHYAAVVDGLLSGGTVKAEYVGGAAQDRVVTWNDPTSTKDWAFNGTVVQENTGYVPGSMAFAVDVDLGSSYATRVANPAPTGSGTFGGGIVAAHLGTSQLSHVENAWTAFSATDELPLDLPPVAGDLSASLLYWADLRDRAYGMPTRDYFDTTAEALAAAARLSPGQFVEVRPAGV